MIFKVFFALSAAFHVYDDYTSQNIIASVYLKFKIVRILVVAFNF